MERKLKKIFAAGVAAALIFLSPGLPCYQAIAADFEGGAPKGATGAPIGAAKIADLSVPLAGTKISGVGGANPDLGVDVKQSEAGVPEATVRAEGAQIVSPSEVRPQAESATTGETVPAATPEAADAYGKGVGTAETSSFFRGAETNLSPTTDAEVAKTLSDLKAEKSGMLAWIFERIRRKGARAAIEVPGIEKSHAPDLSPATAKPAAAAASVPAPVPAPAADAKKTLWERFKSILDFSQYTKTQKAFILGQAIFIVGIAIYITSMPLLVTALTGSTAFTGTVRLVHYVTFGVVSLFAGEVVKRGGMKGTLTKAGRTRAGIYAAIGALALALGTGMPLPLFLVLVGLNALVVAHNHLVDIDASGAAKVFPDKEQRKQSLYQFLFIRYGALLVVPWVFGYTADKMDVFFGAGVGAKVGMLLLAAALSAATWMYSKMDLGAEGPETRRSFRERLAAGRSVTLKILFDTPGRIKRTASAIWANGKIRVRVLMSMAEQFLEDALFFVVMPTFVVDILGQKNMGNGLVSSAIYLGGLLAMKVLMKHAAKIEKKHGEFKLIAGLSVLAALAFIPSIGLWAFPSLYLALPMVLLMKLMLAPIQAKMSNLLQTAIDEDPRAKAEEENIWSLITTPEVVAAGLGGFFFEKLFEHSAPGGFLYDALGVNGPMKVVTIALMAFAALYLGSLSFLKRQIEKPMRKVHQARDVADRLEAARAALASSQAENAQKELDAALDRLSVAKNPDAAVAGLVAAIKEAKNAVERGETAGLDAKLSEMIKLATPQLELFLSMAKLENNLERMGLPPYTTETVEGPADQRRPTVGILAPASVYKLAIAQEGSRQSEGDVHLILDPAWLIEETSHQGDTVWYMTKGLTFKGGKPVLVEYKDPRRIRYRANFYTDGANGRGDGVVYEKGDTPSSNSVQLDKITNDKLLTRMMLAARGVAVPATLGLLMAAHPLLNVVHAGVDRTKEVVMTEMPADREQVRRDIETYLETYKGEDIVVKPSGPNFHSAIGVEFFRRGQVDAMVDHVLKLKNDPLMSPDGVVLVEQRILPPALYFRTKDHAGDGPFGYLEGKKVEVQALRPQEIPSAEPWERKDWNFRVLAARAPWGAGVGKGIFARAGKWGKPTNAEAKDPRDSAAILTPEEVVRELRLQHGLLKADAEVKAFIAELERIGAEAVDAIALHEQDRKRGEDEGAQTQTDYIGLDVIVQFENGKPVPYIIEVNDHDAGGQWQLDEFYPEKAGEHSRAWMATALARARRDAMKGRRMVVVGAGYPNKRFFLERAKQLGIQVVLVDKGLTGWGKLKDWVRVKLGHPSQDNWAKDLVSEFIAVDTTKPEQALAAARKKLQRSIRKNGKLDGITTYWEDDIVLTAHLAETLGLPYHSVTAAEAARNKAVARDMMEKAGLDKTAHRLISSRADIEAAVADPDFPFPAVIKPTAGAEAQFTGIVERDDALSVYDKDMADIAASHDPIFEQSRARLPKSMFWLAPANQGLMSALAGSLRRALSRFFGRVHVPAKGGHELVLEEYLTGHEWDANIVIENGTMVAGSITDNTPVRDDQKTLKPGEKRQLNMKSTGAFLPSVQLTQDEQIEALRFAARAARALGVKNGVLHIEGKTGLKGPRLLEVNLRPGGSYVVHWNKKVTGIDEAEMLYALALGVPAVAYQSPEPLAHLAGKFVFSDREGKVSYIGLSPEAQAAGLDAIFEKKPGAVVDFKDNDRVAFLHAQGSTMQEAIENLGAEPHKNLALEIQPLADETEAVARTRWAAFVKSIESIAARFSRRSPK